MKKRIGFLMILLFGLTLFISGTGLADQGEFGLAVKGGTLGAGLEGTVGITETVNARVGFNYFPYNYTGTESDIEYDFDLTLLNVPLLFDWHPNGSGFRVSAGAMFNGNNIDGKAIFSGTIDINGTTYTAAEVGTLKSEIDFNTFAPYVGIGYGNAVGKDLRWSFALDLGVTYQGSPSVKYTTTGTNPAGLTADLNAEAESLESELGNFQWYPVIMLGISYKF